MQFNSSNNKEIISNKMPINLAFSRPKESSCLIRAMHRKHFVNFKVRQN